ncbi:VOC family protein [Lutimonas halocynthiae]|uniref:SMU1112c/YaeR family gloxylase I-like metalloprotein n=1 Tax=Lutimonas halocynthiae TaxID=1446477 RepID=UPI0025B4A7A3|nr:VOC family protein [Lutimonas halocynthiae]MDN3643322.1 VOC family protein [Lutimonas halocynthiae]
MIKINRMHHIAIICSDYERSKHFYTQVLGFKIEQEIYRKERDSFKLDLSLNGQYMIELFSFSNPPKRLTRPEGLGLRHLAFEVDDLEASIEELAKKGVQAEPVRVDDMTHKKFTFFFDPDDLPLELYER